MTTPTPPDPAHRVPPPPPAMSEPPPVPTAPTPAPAAPVPAGLAVPSPDHTLHPAVRWYWRLPLAVLGTMTVLVLAIVASATGVTQVWGATLIAFLVFATATVMLPDAQYARWRWRLTEHACEAEHGVFTHQVRVLPYFRIQHIDVEHGPVDRWLGLARLRIHTASVTTTLPGLSDAVAGQLRTRLLDLAAEETRVAAPEARDAV